MISLWFRSVPEGCTYYIFIIGASSFSKTLVYHQGLAKEVWRCHIQKGCRVWETRFQYRKVLLDIDFLDTCLKNNIILKFVQFRVSNKDLRNPTAYRQCQIKLFKQEISNKKKKLKTLRRDLSSVKNELSLKLIFIYLNHLCNLFLIGKDEAILKHEQSQNKKLSFSFVLLRAAIYQLFKLKLLIQKF